MKITHQKYLNHNLANENERGENLGVDFILSSILGILVITIIYLVTPYENLSFKDYLKAFAVFSGVRFLYYFVFELLFSRTPGKFQTQTKVVNKEGNKPNVFQLLIRSLTRFITVISGISDDERAVHDSASNTFVVQDSNLKRIESRQPMILLFNLLLGVFWVYYFTVKLEKTTSETALLIALILATLYGFMVGIRRIGSKKNLKKYR